MRAGGAKRHYHLIITIISPVPLLRKKSAACTEHTHDNTVVDTQAILCSSSLPSTMARHAIALLLAAVLAASSLVAANADGVPVYVMVSRQPACVANVAATVLPHVSRPCACSRYAHQLPLNAITSDNQVNNPSQLSSWFKELKGGGVTGVMSDTWWGLTEPEPQRYNFTGYQSLLKVRCLLVPPLPW